MKTPSVLLLALLVLLLYSNCQRNVYQLVGYHMSTDQHTQLRAILQLNQQQQATARATYRAGSAARRRELRRIEATTQQQLELLLSPDQLTNFRSNRDKIERRFRDER